MLLREIKGRAVHCSGGMRVDRRPGTSPNWEYQMLMLNDPDDPVPEWVPVDSERAKDWPEDGWESAEDWGREERSG